MTSHWITPLQMLYIMTLTYIFKVIICGNHIIIWHVNHITTLLADLHLLAINYRKMCNVLMIARLSLQIFILSWEQISVYCQKILLALLLSCYLEWADSMTYWFFYQILRMLTKCMQNYFQNTDLKTKTKVMSKIELKLSALNRNQN